jgi:hypothetical protein
MQRHSVVCFARQCLTLQPGSEHDPLSTSTLLCILPHNVGIFQFLHVRDISILVRCRRAIWLGKATPLKRSTSGQDAREAIGMHSFRATMLDLASTHPPPPTTQ